MTTVPSPPPPPVPAVPAASPAEPCPICGGNLAVVILGPESAPWLCARDRRGWFAAELAADARADFRPAQRCFGYGVVAKVLADADQEVGAARGRGTSCRPDQLRHLSPAERAVLAGRPGLDAAFLAQVRSLDAVGGG